MKRLAYLSIFLIAAAMLSRPAQAAPVGKITFVFGRVDITVGSRPAKPRVADSSLNRSSSCVSISSWPCPHLGHLPPQTPP